MKALLQRVTSSSVSVGGETVGKIGKGITVLLGVVPEDTQKDIDWLAEKVVNLRIFDDGEGKMNLSVKDVGGEILVISQFTLCGDARHGRRPGYTDAAPPELARVLYEACAARLGALLPVQTGVFQADMQVSLVNDGPFTILLDSRRRF